LHAEISIDFDKSMVEIKGVLVSICDFERESREQSRERAEQRESTEREHFVNHL